MRMVELMHAHKTIQRCKAPQPSEGIEVTVTDRAEVVQDDLEQDERKYAHWYQ